jgi:hypothetical protein
MNYTKGEWKVRNQHGVTGPTTAALPAPVCGGEDWPYEDVIIGQDTIAIVPAQPSNHIVGEVGKPIKGSNIANAHLIAAAPGMYEALKELHKVFFMDFKVAYTNEQNIALNNAFTALAKAEGRD